MAGSETGLPANRAISSMARRAVENPENDVSRLVRERIGPVRVDAINAALTGDPENPTPADRLLGQAANESIDKALAELIAEGRIEQLPDGRYALTEPLEAEVMEAQIVVGTDHGDEAVGLALNPERTEIVGTIPDTPARKIAETEGLARLAEITGLPIAADAVESVMVPFWELSLGDRTVQVTCDPHLDARNRTVQHVWAQAMAEAGDLISDYLVAETILRLRSEAERIEPGLADWWERKLNPGLED
jgi:hypothetical protein